MSKEQSDEATVPDRVVEGPRVPSAPKLSASTLTSRGPGPPKITGEVIATLLIQGDALSSLAFSREKVEQIYYHIFGESLVRPEPGEDFDLSGIDGIIPRFRATTDRNLDMACNVSVALDSILERLSDDL